MFNIYTTESIDEIYKHDEICLCQNNKTVKKFKNCCYGKGLSIFDYCQLYFMNHNISVGQKCIYDKIWIKCNKDPIDSHTISKSKHLTTLAGDQEFLFKISPKRSGKNSMVLEFKKSGPVSSSLFKGCCLQHDSLYNPIDKDFDIDNIDHYLLQAQRQYLYEYYQHKNIVLRINKLKHKLDGYVEALENVKRQHEKIMANLIIDINLFKENIDIENKTMKKTDSRDYSCYCIKFNDKIPFTFSGVFTPYLTMNGETIFTEEFVKSENHLPSIYTGLLYSETGSFLIFLCRKNDHNLQKFIKDIKNDDEKIMQNLLKLSFMISNSYYNKDFVDNYLEVNKDIVLDVYKEDLLAYNEMYNPQGRLDALKKLPIVQKKLDFKYTTPK